MIGNKIFSTEVVSGICPECNDFTLLVSFAPTHYRCTSCGSNLEQKVNGVIKYILADEKTKFDTYVDGEKEI
jgi:transposase-like protein